jgi:hypothetical protein
MESSSNINELPVNPIGGGGGGGGNGYVGSSNINFTASEITPNANAPISYNPNIENTNSNTNTVIKSNPEVSLDQTTINQIINGLQQAGTTTQLQSRDIPQNTENFTQDPQIQANYIPRPESMKDYIQDMEDNDDIVDNYNEKMKNMNKLDQMYNELQTPLLISLLFFLFQLPIVKKLLFNYIPFLFFKDGNINLYGYSLTSIIFGLLYYILMKVMNYFSTF